MSDYALSSWLCWLFPPCLLLDQSRASEQSGAFPFTADVGVHRFFLCCCFADALDHKFAVDLFFIAAHNGFSQFVVREFPRCH